MSVSKCDLQAVVAMPRGNGSVQAGRRTRGWLLAGCMMLLALNLTGCGNSNPLGRKPVRGTVTVDGQPIEYGTISFSPENQTGTASGGIIVRGEYSLPVEKGLPPGKYVVRVIASKSSGDASDSSTGGPSGPGVDLVAPQYNSKTTLTAEVTADKEAVFDFATTSR